jgi:hypothetical protein
VYNALKWFVNKHEDYRNNVTVDEERMSDWESIFVAVVSSNLVSFHENDTSFAWYQMIDKLRGNLVRGERSEYCMLSGSLKRSVFSLTLNN